MVPETAHVDNALRTPAKPRAFRDDAITQEQGRAYPPLDLSMGELKKIPRFIGGRADGAKRRARPHRRATSEHNRPTDPVRCLRTNRERHAHNQDVAQPQVESSGATAGQYAEGCQRDAVKPSSAVRRGSPRETRARRCGSLRRAARSVRRGRYGTRSAHRTRRAVQHSLATDREAPTCLARRGHRVRAATFLPPQHAATRIRHHVPPRSRHRRRRHDAGVRLNHGLTLGHRGSGRSRDGRVGAPAADLLRALRTCARLSAAPRGRAPRNRVPRQDHADRSGRDEAILCTLVVRSSRSPNRRRGTPCDAPRAPGPCGTQRLAFRAAPCECGVRPPRARRDRG